MSSAEHVRRAAVGLLFAVGASGCSFTTMAPAHRLEAGEIVVQGAADVPGFLYIPRLSLATTLGAGNADFGLHVGTTAFTLNAGLTGRAYLGERWALSLQGDGMITLFEEDLFSSGTRMGFISATTRFGRLLAGNERFYWGLQAQAIIPYRVSEASDIPSGTGFAAGGYLGYAWDSPGNVDVQAELSGTPVGLFPGLTEGGEDRYTLTMTPLVQVGIALQYRKERGADDGRPEPSETNPDPVL